ncbi:MAG: CocE/NonD family hydrolase, partial [Acidobacteriota bacterium]
MSISLWSRVHPPEALGCDRTSEDGAARQSRRPAAWAFAIAALLAHSPTLSAQDISTYVPAPDGVRLATDVYCPVPLCLGRWPVVLQRTPYGKEGLKSWCQGFLVLGYACVAQDERGRGASEGTYTGY